MQRVISLQTCRNADRGTSEFVTKRLCCSILLSVAILCLFGGVFIGQYAAERDIRIKNIKIQEKQQEERNFALDTMNNLSTLMTNITNSIVDVYIDDVATYTQKLNCINITLPHNQSSRIDGNNANNVINVKTSRILNQHLEKLNRCFTDIYAYLQQLNHDSVVTHDSV